MFNIVTIEGVKVKARMIPKKSLISIWKTLTTKPFPKVKAFQLENSDFNHVVRLTKSIDDERREMQEWGRVLSIEGTDSFVYNADEFADVDYVIVIREKPYHNIGEILEHELSHIARGDL
jgi:hypothetical protein